MMSTRHQQNRPFFGTQTGTARLIAKKIQKKLGDDIASKPLNVNRITPAERMQYDALILGTPSDGVKEIPERSVGCLEANWAGFLAQLVLESPPLRA